jgi:hypothetical protein
MRELQKRAQWWVRFREEWQESGTEDVVEEHHEASHDLTSFVADGTARDHAQEASPVVEKATPPGFDLREQQKQSNQLALQRLKATLAGPSGLTLTAQQIEQNRFALGQVLGDAPPGFSLSDLSAEKIRENQLSLQRACLGNGTHTGPPGLASMLQQHQANKAALDQTLKDLAPPQGISAIAEQRQANKDALSRVTPPGLPRTQQQMRQDRIAFSQILTPPGLTPTEVHKQYNVTALAHILTTRGLSPNDTQSSSESSQSHRHTPTDRENLRDHQEECTPCPHVSYTGDAPTWVLGDTNEAGDGASTGDEGGNGAFAVVEGVLRVG